MSIENLIGAYPADADFAAGISRHQEFQRPKAKVVALADLFYRKGSEGLRELDRQLKMRRISVNKDMVPSKPLTREENDMLSNNRAAVM